MSDLKDALAFYELNGYLQPFQCDLVVERIAKLEAEIERLTMMLAEYVRLDNAGKIPLEPVGGTEDTEVKG